MDGDRIETLKAWLPRNPGLHSRDDYLNTAIMVLVNEEAGELQFLFQKRAPGIRQGGEISFPGGVIDPRLDKSPRDTAVRETVEEMGIPREAIRVIGPLDTMVAPLGVTVDGFLGFTPLPVAEMKPNEQEVERVFAVPVRYFRDTEPEVFTTVLRSHPTYIDESTGEEIEGFPARELGLPERYHQPWGGRKHKIYVWRLPQGVLWGITARFVYDLVKRIPTGGLVP